MTLAARLQTWRDGRNEVENTWFAAHYRPAHDSLLAAILADERLRTLAQLGADSELAAALPCQTELISKLVTETGLSGLIGEEKTAVVLLALEAASVPEDDSLAAKVKAKVAAQRRKMLDNSGPGIDLSLASTRKAIADMVDATLIDAEDQAALLAACTRLTSRKTEEVSAALLPFRFNCQVGECP